MAIIILLIGANCLHVVANFDFSLITKSSLFVYNKIAMSFVLESYALGLIMGLEGP